MQPESTTSAPASRQNSKLIVIPQRCLEAAQRDEDYSSFCAAAASVASRHGYTNTHPSILAPSKLASDMRKPTQRNAQQARGLAPKHAVLHAQVHCNLRLNCCKDCQPRINATCCSSTSVNKKGASALLHNVWHSTNQTINARLTQAESSNACMQG